MQPPPPPWSEIPLDLAGLVLGRLPAHADRVRFAAACRRWRAAAPQPTPTKPFRLPAAAAGFTAACGSWLLFSGADGGSCFLRNPFSNATVPLPALYRVRKRYKSSGAQPIFTCETTDGSTKLYVRRLLLCSPHLVAAYVVLGPGAVISYMAVCQPGAGSWWSVCMDDSLISEERSVPTLAAMAFYKGTLFAVERYRGRFYAVDIGVDKSTGDLWVSRFRRVIPGSIPTTCGPSIPHDNGNNGNGIELMETLFYLVESRGALLVVRRQRQYQYQWDQLHERRLVVPTGWKEFEVFEADLQGSRWTKLATIGNDQVLFLSENHCASLCVSQLGMPGDRIVFFENVDEDRIGKWYEEESIGACSVYDMRDRKISALLPMPLHSKHGTVRATWLFLEEPSEAATI
ncbi:unnamed protein product [Urochloa decumbens]|uniref:KIB1-4 beta-propeller domain-containing protein n=1 Tax=Urochloa decumbens TaxID=240449 RepID=A0ABC9APF9_9POAL